MLLEKSRGALMQRPARNIQLACNGLIIATLKQQCHDLLLPGGEPDWFLHGSHWANLLAKYKGTLRASPLGIFLQSEA